MVIDSSIFFLIPVVSALVLFADFSQVLSSGDFSKVTCCKSNGETVSHPLVKKNKDIFLC